MGFGGPWVRVPGLLASSDSDPKGLGGSRIRALPQCSLDLGPRFSIMLECRTRAAVVPLQILETGTYVGFF